ncbi:Rieske (2Fe-2S) protein [Bradyrhizobium nanningense]|uniref:Rieske (2Fe-2S) protein n=1 Tax=Bradyrhizobium nanningense TaxID=1325118 RepID=UPI001ABF2B7A|nr:Rieske (2Fe-2S) protein [Bradyrhizobium nanningense]
MSGNQEMAERASEAETKSQQPASTPVDYPVGPASDFPPGSHRIVQVRTQEVGVFNVNGNLHALVNVCPHQYGPVCDGPVGGEMRCNASTGWKFQWSRDGEILICPWHGLEFDLTTGRCLAPKEMRLRKCKVNVVEGEVRVSLTGG